MKPDLTILSDDQLRAGLLRRRGPQRAPWQAEKARRIAERSGLRAAALAQAGDAQQAGLAAKLAAGCARFYLEQQEAV